MTEPAPDSTPPLSFDEARERLRARGYLDRGVEGAVLKGTLSARSRLRGLVQGAGIASALLALVLATAQTAMVAVANSLPVRDGAVLFGWLLLGALVLASVLVTGLGGLAWVRMRGRGDAEHASTEIGIVFGLVAGAAGAFAAIPAMERGGLLGALGVLFAIALAVFVSFRIARGIALAVLVASGRALLARQARSRAIWVVGLGIVVAVSGTAALLAFRATPPADVPLVVAANTRRVVVIGIDGWSDRYLERRREPEPHQATATYSYQKSEHDPAAFWTTVATGEEVRRHGIGSLDLVRVSGLRSPVKPVALSGWLLGHALPALSLARRESVTSAARRVPAVWEVAARGGIPSLVVNWWTTYPAASEASSATVLSNHLFFAARAGASLKGEGWPEEAAARAARLAPRVAPEPGTVDRLIADAEGLDAFSIRAFEEAFARDRPRLSLLYLPGLDILGSALGDPTRGAADRVALAEALKKEAARIDAFLKSDLLRTDIDLLAMLLDGGRVEQRGRLVLAGPLVSADPERARSASFSPPDLAPTVLAALGVPASREIAGRVLEKALAPVALSRETVKSWGRRRAPSSLPIGAKEYVENLRSLGYLK